MIIIPPPSSQRREHDRQLVQEAIAQAGLNLPDAAITALQQGRVIEAVKLIRSANPGLDLARAKAMMEKLQAQARTTAAGAARSDVAKAVMQAQPQRPPTVAMGDPPGQLRWLLALVVALVAVLWIVFDGRV